MKAVRNNKKRATEHLEAEVAAEIRNAGLKATKMRIKIYSLFKRDDIGHISAEDIYRLFLTEDEEISLGTVYRVLTQFENVHLIIRHQFKANASMYELSGKHHDHMICNQCGCIVEFMDPSIERLQEKVAKTKDFEVTDHSLTMRVDCTRKGCRGRNSN